MTTAHPKPSIVLAFVVGAALLMGGCLGQQARTRVLSPAVTMGAARAVADAERSPAADRELVDQFKASIASGDYGSAVVVWPAVYSCALDGIDRRADVSAGVKVSLKEPLRQFDVALRKAAARSYENGN